MAKTAAVMLAALFVLSALLSSSSAVGWDIDFVPLPIPGDASPAKEPSEKVSTKVCNSAEQCGGEGGGGGGNRKLLGESEAPATAMEAVEKGAEDLKTRFMSLFQ
ncbi:hypothetical protein AAHA92_04946 [Salvia divinorum]|uniref:Uncharacterized protein n=1 Tax=Salvia divinorum TaxID=28513 RepID=A0ABD1I0V5_SALDI